MDQSILVTEVGNHAVWRVAGNGGKSGKGKSKGKGGGGGGDQGGAAGVVGGEGEGAAGGNSGLVREVLKAADMLQAEGLFRHCLEAFRGGLTVNTAIEHLVWAHQGGPTEARDIATEFFVANGRTIRVRVLGPVCVLLE